MKLKDKDIMHELFASIPDESLPFNLNEKVMVKIQQEALFRRKRNRRREIFGYASGVVAMLALCVLILYYIGVPFEMPKLESHAWAFPKPDYGVFRSQSFILSVYVGILALFLLVADSLIRHHIEKTKHK